MSFLARSPPGDKSSHGCCTYYTPISARSSPCPVPWYLARTGGVAAARPWGDGNESGWGWREKRAILRSLKEAGSCPKSLSRPGFCPICTTAPKRFQGILPTDLAQGRGKRGRRRRGDSALTCESFRPSLAASFLRSGLLMYFCFWNIFSSALRCTSENTARRSMPRRGLPRAASGQEKVPGMGTTLEDAAECGQVASKWAVSRRDPAAFASPPPPQATFSGFFSLIPSSL